MVTEAIKLQEIVITGFGGQGVVLAGNILGKAASLFDKKESTLIQSYGPEARGGSCSAQVVIAKEKILYPYVHTPHVLICLSHEGFTKNITELRSGGIVLWDSDLVKTEDKDKEFNSFNIPATRFAEEMGNKMMANIIMLGFTTAIWGGVSEEAMKKSVSISVPPGTEEKNLKAFERGFEFGKTVLMGVRKRIKLQQEEEEK